MTVSVHIQHRKFLPVVGEADSDRTARGKQALSYTHSNNGKSISLQNTILPVTSRISICWIQLSQSVVLFEHFSACKGGQPMPEKDTFKLKMRRLCSIV